MSFGKVAVGQYRPQAYPGATSAAKRKVGLPLWIGILGLPWVFAWAVLGKGYSGRVRTIALGYMAILTIVPLAFGSHDQKSAASPAAQPQSTADVVVPPSPELVEAQDRLKRSSATLAESYLTTALLAPGESAQHFNARVTGLYNNWVKAEEAAYGANWQNEYLAQVRQDRDCSNLYGPLSHEDDQLRQARDMCAVAAQAPAPTSVPTLNDYLIKGGAASGSTGDTAAADSGASPSVSTASGER